MVQTCKCVGMLSGGKWDSMNDSCRRVYDPNYLSPTLTAHGGGNQDVKIVSSNTLTTVQKDNVVAEGLPFRVRKLTPKETWRLMGFDDDSFNRAAQQVSNSQLYKQSGNSIVVDVLMAIFKQMLPEEDV